MKKVMAVAIVFAFLCVTGIALAAEGEGAGCCAKGTSSFNCMAKCVQSLGKGCMEKGAVEKAPASELTDKELRIQRENTGMGMRGRIK